MTDAYIILLKKCYTKFSFDHLFVLVQNFLCYYLCITWNENNHVCIGDAIN